MRKTTVQGAFRLTISRPFASGTLRILYQVLGLTAAVLVTSLWGPSAVCAQGPYCTGFNCTANAVQNPTYFIGDVNGNLITSVVRTPGQPVANVSPCLIFQGTAANLFYNIHAIIADFCISATCLSGKNVEIQADSFSTIALTSFAPGTTDQCAWINSN